MKIFIASSLLIGLTLITLNSIEKTGKLIDKSQVTYNLTEDKVLDGAYTIQDAANVTRLRGSYAKDKRTGNWYCFNSKGKLVLRYNYDLKKLVHFEDEELNGVEITVLDKDTDVVKNASIPLPICSIEQFKTLIVSELKDEISLKNKDVGADVEAEITALVKADGKVLYNVKYALKGLSYTTMVFPKDKLFSIQWLPATYKDKAYKSEFKFSSTFKLEASDHKRFIWNY